MPHHVGGNHPKWAVAERNYSDLERNQVSKRGRKPEREDA